MLRSRSIERELRDILAVTGLHHGKFNLPARRMLRALEDHQMWNPEGDFGDSWYRDPDDESIKHGWSESMEFVGRVLE